MRSAASNWLVNLEVAARKPSTGAEFNVGAQRHDRQRPPRRPARCPPRPRRSRRKQGPRHAGTALKIDRAATRGVGTSMRRQAVRVMFIPWAPSWPKQPPITWPTSPRTLSRPDSSTPSAPARACRLGGCGPGCRCACPPLSAPPPRSPPVIAVLSRHGCTASLTSAWSSPSSGPVDSTNGYWPGGRSVGAPPAQHPGSTVAASEHPYRLHRRRHHHHHPSAPPQERLHPLHVDRPPGGFRDLADTVMAIHDCPKPVIAKIDGSAVGGGPGVEGW